MSWADLGLSQAALDLVNKQGFGNPTPIQSLAIPPALKGQDVVGSAPTGTGKTASFVLPMVERFAGREGTFGMILAPTREIAQQIQATIELFGTPRGVRSIVLIGGVDYATDARAINSYPQIIVATPGRLCDHLDRGNLWLDYIEVVVLDEADRMLDMGFAAQLARAMEEVPKNRQTLLFSATIPPEVDKLARKILHDPKQVIIGKRSAAAHTVEQRLLWMSQDSKNSELMRLIRSEAGSIIVFCRSKDGATRIWRSLHSAGIYDATYIHSDRLQSHREQALQEFKDGKYRVLVATDVAGRGLHIDGVAHVVNYDLPMEAENYIHRIGRTGRAGMTGKSTTFVTPGDRKLLREIQQIVGHPIPEDFARSWRDDRPRESARPQQNSAGPVRAQDFPRVGGPSHADPNRPKPAARRRRGRRGGGGQPV